MNNQCKDCIHINVCAYKEHYDDVINMYKAIKEESSKYPWFRLELTCIQHLRSSVQKEDPFDQQLCLLQKGGQRNE